nr:hypothetical protein JVH1_6626 [Rhodococcus sp. JVH1]
MAGAFPGVKRWVCHSYFSVAVGEEILCESMVVSRLSSWLLVPGRDGPPGGAYLIEL